jgi:hypothetical protein
MRPRLSVENTSAAHEALLREREPERKAPAADL